MMLKKLKSRKQFFKFQLTAVIATSVDFLVTIFLKEITGLHYAAAVAAGAASGATTAFTINRHWVFKSKDNSAFHQAYRYLLVAAGSVLLNTSGTYLLTEVFKLQYLISKTIIGIIVGFTYSYHFSKRLVFYV